MVDDYSNYFEVNILNQITSAAIITSIVEFMNKTEQKEQK